MAVDSEVMNREWEFVGRGWLGFENLFLNSCYLARISSLNFQEWKKYLPNSLLANQKSGSQNGRLDVSHTLYMAAINEPAGAFSAPSGIYLYAQYVGFTVMIPSAVSCDLRPQPFSTCRFKMGHNFPANRGDRRTPEITIRWLLGHTIGELRTLRNTGTERVMGS